MNWLLFHLASGHAFFTGAALISGAAVFSLGDKPKFVRLIRLLAIVGLVTIGASSSAIDYGYYLIAAVMTCVWFINLASQSRKRWKAWATIIVCVVGAILEIPYHFMPSLGPVPDRSIAIVGDSITAGMGERPSNSRWPNRLATQHDLQIQDLSHMGDTVSSALNRLGTRPIDASLVVVEIGGNDILGGTSGHEFERDLDALLERLTAPNRQLVMFELPLPPLYHEFGRIQRKLAAKHHVKLVPKRVLWSVLCTEGATVDTIHLTASGHQQLADEVWRVLRPAVE